MTWTVAASLDELTAAADDHLRSDPVRNTVTLTVLSSLRHSGLSAFGDGPPVFGWHETAEGTVDCTFLQTGPFPLLLSALPPGSAASLLEALRAGPGLPAAVNIPQLAEASFLTAWETATAGTGTARMRSRLHRLAGLVPPDPAPAGIARLAGPDDRDLLVRWHEDFASEAESGAGENAARTVDDRLSHSGLLLWQAGDEHVAMAGSTRAVAGVVRIAGVYTPPAHRRRGYGGAVTAAASQAALDAGAAAVVLYTDLSNPTSNALYARLGFRPVEDRVVLDLTPAGQAAVTADEAASSQGI
jgi:ribosomal protein S18 acetylase RimI-like enzyme